MIEPAMAAFTCAAVALEANPSGFDTAVSVNR
jgi:hypothetical protein